MFFKDTIPIFIVFILLKVFNMLGTVEKLLKFCITSGIYEYKLPFLGK
jgi:hypothetical protein